MAKGIPKWFWFVGVPVGMLTMCGTCVAVVGSQATDTASAKPTAAASKATGETKTEQPAPQPAAMTVEIGDLLSSYKNNEVAADGKFKGQRITTTGKVGDIKKDILGDPYVMVGRGKRFEVPELQCSLAEDQVAAASGLSKGQQVTVTGTVSGLMMNVQAKDCTID